MNRAFLLAILAISLTSTAFAEGAVSGEKVALERAKGERLATAIGHYGRARSLLIAAVREFDKGAAMAGPDALLDTAAWRKSLVERAKDLERVLDPQPRVTNSGVKFDADTRLLGEAGK